MTLTAENVDRIFTDCLFQENEDTSTAVKAEGVKHNFGFHPGRLESHKTEIKEMLDCLPDPFKAESGGGWSFLNACETKDGDLWGEHVNVEQLLVLGLATNQAKFLMPRSAWNAFPGGMPFFVVGEQKEDKK